MCVTGDQIVLLAPLNLAKRGFTSPSLRSAVPNVPNAESTSGPGRMYTWWENLESDFAEGNEGKEN